MKISTISKKMKNKWKAAQILGKVSENPSHSKNDDHEILSRKLALLCSFALSVARKTALPVALTKVETLHFSLKRRSFKSRAILRFLISCCAINW